MDSSTTGRTGWSLSYQYKKWYIKEHEHARRKKNGLMAKVAKGKKKYRCDESERQILHNLSADYMQDRLYATIQWMLDRENDKDEIKRVQIEKVAEI